MVAQFEVGQAALAEELAVGEAQGAAVGEVAEGLGREGFEGGFVDAKQASDGFGIGLVVDGPGFDQVGLLQLVDQLLGEQLIVVDLLQEFDDLGGFFGRFVFVGEEGLGVGVLSRIDQAGVVAINAHDVLIGLFGVYLQAKGVAAIQGGDVRREPAAFGADVEVEAGVRDCRAMRR